MTGCSISGLNSLICLSLGAQLPLQHPIYAWNILRSSLELGVEVGVDGAPHALDHQQVHASACLCQSIGHPPEVDTRAALTVGQDEQLCP